MRKRRRSAQGFRGTFNTTSSAFRGPLAAPPSFSRQSTPRAPISLSVALVVVAFFILAGEAVLFIDEAHRILHAETQQERNGMQLFHLRLVLEDLRDAELGQRGFLLTGQESYLEPYVAAVRDIDRNLRNVRQMFFDEPATLALLARIEELKQKKFDEMAKTISEYRHGGLQSAGARIRSGVDKQYMDEARAILNQQMDAVRARRTELNKDTANRVRYAGHLLLGIALLLVVIVGYAIKELIYSSKRNAELAKQMEVEATHDELTGLPNRRLLIEWLRKALARATRSGGSVAVLFIDLDGFKNVNDKFGHEAGDAALRAVTRRFTRTLRAQDTVARFGGDEFAVVVNDQSRADLERLAQRLTKTFKAPLRNDLPANALGASIGIAMYPQHGKTLNALLRAADRAMYQAKRTGKSHYCFAGSVGRSRIKRPA